MTTAETPRTDERAGVGEASAIVGDDIAFWLGNRFVTPEMIAAKVAWWIERLAQHADDHLAAAVARAEAAEARLAAVLAYAAKWEADELTTVIDKTAAAYCIRAALDVEPGGGRGV